MYGALYYGLLLNHGQHLQLSLPCHCHQLQYLNSHYYHYWFNAEMPIEEVPRLSPCPAPPPAMLSKIPDNNATRNTKLSPNVIGDPRMQMPTCQLAYMPTCLHANMPSCQHADLLNCLCATCLLANMPKCRLANMPTY